MSEPDAVPLPREGEVFFDVRGEARSMRLSWYADSQVAVFSIWQANRCTGTFRLPFADLARMVHTLQSGPGQNQDLRGVPDYGAAPAATQAYAASPVYNGYSQEPVHGQDYGPGAGYQQAAFEPPYPLPDYDPPNYQDMQAHQDARYGPGPAGPGGYERTGYERTGEYRAPQDRAGFGYERAAHDGARYDGASYDGASYDGASHHGASREQERDGYEPDGYGASAPGGWPATAETTRPGPRLSATGQPGHWPGESGYGYGGQDVTVAGHDLPNFPSVPARTGQSAADWALP